MAEIVAEFSIKDVESFHLHCIYKGKTKQRSVILKNARKICSTRKWKFYNVLQKTRVWVMAVFDSNFIIEKDYYFCLDLHFVNKIQTGQRHT